MEAEKHFACRKSGKAPERSNFAQTCSLLSQYLKEKGSFGDLRVEVAKKLEAAKGKSEIVRPPPVTTMDLLPNIEKSSEESWKQKTDAPPTMKSNDILPKIAGFDSSDSVEEAIDTADLRNSATTDPETAQMTIVYAGQVLVFNDFPAEKAKKIMLLARTGSSHTFSAVNPSQSNPGRSVASSSKNVSTPTTNPTQYHVQVQPQPNGSSLPIMTRASLNKFFEKRKDRVTAKAPYQVNNPSSPPNPGTSSSWLELEAQTSNQLELKL